MRKLIFVSLFGVILSHQAFSQQGVGRFPACKEHYYRCSASTCARGGYYQNNCFACQSNDFVDRTLEGSSKVELIKKLKKFCTEQGSIVCDEI